MVRVFRSVDPETDLGDDGEFWVFAVGRVVMEVTAVSSNRVQCA